MLCFPNSNPPFQANEPSPLCNRVNTSLPLHSLRPISMLNYSSPSSSSSSSLAPSSHALPIYSQPGIGGLNVATDHSYAQRIRNVVNACPPAQLKLALQNELKRIAESHGRLVQLTVQHQWSAQAEQAKTAQMQAALYTQRRIAEEHIEATATPRPAAEVSIKGGRNSRKEAQAAAARRGSRKARMGYGSCVPKGDIVVRLPFMVSYFRRGYEKPFNAVVTAITPSPSSDPKRLPYKVHNSYVGPKYPEFYNEDPDAPISQDDQLFLLMCWENDFVHPKERKDNLSATLAYNFGRNGVEVQARQQAWEGASRCCMGKSEQSPRVRDYLMAPNVSFIPAPQIDFADPATHARLAALIRKYNLNSEGGAFDKNPITNPWYQIIDPVAPDWRGIGIDRAGETPSTKRGRRPKQAGSARSRSSNNARKAESLRRGSDDGNDGQTDDEGDLMDGTSSAATAPNRPAPTRTARFAAAASTAPASASAIRGGGVGWVTENNEGRRNGGTSSSSHSGQVRPSTATLPNAKRRRVDKNDTSFDGVRTVAATRSESQTQILSRDAMVG